MEVGDTINTSSMGIIEQEENENDDLLVAMDGKNLHDEDAVYIMENAYQENDDDDCENQQYIVEEEEMEPTEDEDIEDMYNCNVCGMNFTSIDEHIQQYHSNQEVILDVAEAVETTGQAVKCEPPEYINDVEEDDEVMDAADGETEQIIFVDVDSDGRSSGRSTRNARQSNVHQKETYTCNQCSQPFGTLRSLSCHILNAHGAKLQAPRNVRGSKQVVPKVVRKTERAASILNSEESESDVNERSAEVHTCEQCNTVFQTAKSLKWVLNIQYN